MRARGRGERSLRAAVGKVNGMSQERKSFTVSDRRHFTSEGEPREEPEAPATPAGASEAGETSPGPVPDGAGAVEFASFLLSLAAQAGYLLAGDGGQAKGGLEEARHIISILEMLKDKTEGRRTADEDRVLQEVLYQLRMGYVARTRAGEA